MSDSSSPSKSGLGKVLAFFKPKNSSSQEAKILKELKKDARRYQRYPLCSKDILQVQTREGKTYPVANISFSGFAICGPTDSKTVPLSEEMKLVFLGQSITVFAKQTYINSNALILGYSFTSDTAHDLILLKELMGALKSGSSLKALARQFLKAEYLDDSWTCLRGEGPTDLLVRTKSKGSLDLEELVLTFLNTEEDYQELRYHNGAFITGKAVDKGVGARMRSTQDLDQDILKRALLILAGAQDDFSPLAAHIITILMGKIVS
ncbi:MAG: hypothetical protein KA436_10325 [Oligoflexales bacterium]|nr:hypothetical protein [Oligoflexales bacterium]